MIKFALDLEKNELVLEMQPPFQEPVYAKTSVCIVPDPCPGCGQCLLCDSKCTCSKTQATCALANLCNESGHCLSPANCTHDRPVREGNDVQENLEQAV